MVYETFLQTVTSTLREQLGSSYSIVIRKIPKNNGILLDSLCISRELDTIAPAIYLNSYYDQFMNGMSMEEILSAIENLYRENISCPSINLEHFCSFSQIRDLIAWKLIHAESNQALLKQIPHIFFMDLAVVFYLYLEQSEHGQMTALIYDDHLALWDVTKEDLFRLAEVNTPRLFPATITSMRDMMKQIAQNTLGEDYDEAVMDLLLEKNEQEELFVLTNTVGIHGSCCILYEGELKKFADSLSSDLLILPSSVHEVLLLPDSSDVSYTELSDMVQHINQTEVPAEDQLSNQVYRYSRDSDSISVVSHGQELAHTSETSYGLLS